MLLINFFVSFLEKSIAIKLLDVSPFRISMTYSTRQCKSLVCFSKLPSLIHIDIVLCFFQQKDAWIILCSSWTMVLSEPNSWIFCVLRFFEKEKKKMTFRLPSNCWLKDGLLYFKFGLFKAEIGGKRVSGDRFSFPRSERRSLMYVEWKHLMIFFVWIVTWLWIISSFFFNCGLCHNFLKITMSVLVGVTHCVVKCLNLSTFCSIVWVYGSSFYCWICEQHKDWFHMIEAQILSRFCKEIKLKSFCVLCKLSIRFSSTFWVFLRFCDSKLVFDESIMRACVGNKVDRKDV